MIKLGATILSFPNNKLNLNLMSQLSSIEWTAKMLYEKKPNFTKIDTMLSIIDNDKVQGLITEDHIQAELVNNIVEGTSQGIYQYVYGSPGTRAINEHLNMEQSSQIFIDIINQLDTQLNEQIKPIKFYIEPLPHHKNWLSSMEEVIDLTNILNQELVQLKFDLNIQFMPLIDTGTLLKTNFNFKATEQLAKCTDRIHLSQEDNTKDFKDIPLKVFKFIEQLCYYNDDFTISYEHINLNHNDNLTQFINYFGRLKMHHTSYYDVAVIGSGIYGRYIALKLSQKGLNVAIIGQEESIKDEEKQIASYVNQARVHNGYHYPRSLTTARASVTHYHQFKEDFKDAIIDNFNQIYGISKYGSLTSAAQFKKFANDLNVQCDPYISNDLKMNNIQGSFLVDECAIDTSKMMSIMNKYTENIHYYNMTINQITKTDEGWKVSDQSAPFSNINAKYIVNATYSNINDIEQLAGIEELTPIKLEACEIALFKTDQPLQNAYTFMDGPFVSIMPFSKEGLISMTSVTYTPHHLGKDDFSHIQSKKDIMLKEASQFLKNEYIDQLNYVESRYVVKCVPLKAEDNDNRLITFNEQDHFVSVLSGKLNAIYECDELCNKINKQLKQDEVRGIIL